MSDEPEVIHPQEEDGPAPETSAPLSKPEPTDLVPLTRPREEAIVPYHGIAAAPFGEDVRKVLRRPILPEEVEVRPDGLIYWPGVKVRKRLNEAFGEGGWALLPRGTYTRGTKLFYKGEIWVYGEDGEGRFVSASIGESEYFPTNPRSSEASASESAKTDAIVRGSKDLGIACDCWEPRYQVEWLKAWGVQVKCVNMVEKARRKRWQSDDVRTYWRRFDDPTLGSAAGADVYPYRENPSDPKRFAYLGTKATESAAAVAKTLASAPPAAGPVVEPAVERGPEPAPSDGPPAPTDPLIDENRMANLFALADEKGYKSEAVRKWLHTRFKVASTKELTMAQSAEAIALIQNWPLRPVGQP